MMDTRPVGNIFIYLDNFKLEGIDEVTLHNGCISQSDISSFIDGERRIAYKLPKYQLMLTDYPPEKPRRILDRCLILLKLYKSSMLNSYFLTCNEYNSHDHLPHYNTFIGGEIYKIGVKDIIPLQSFWKKHFDLNRKAPPLILFHIADFSAYNWIAALHYIQCLEALFCPGKYSSEITFRFSIIGSAVLQNHDLGKNRSELYDDLKKFYNIRSKIIHGKKLISPSKETVLRLRLFCFYAINYYLKNNCLDDDNARFSHNKELIL